jgi:hypothetical protein
MVWLNDAHEETDEMDDDRDLVVGLVAVVESDDTEAGEDGTGVVALSENS